MNKWKVVPLNNVKSKIGVIKEIDDKGNDLSQVTEVMALDIANQIVNEHNELRLLKSDTLEEEKFCIICNKTVPIGIRTMPQHLIINYKDIEFEADEAHCTICNNYVYIKHLHTKMLDKGKLVENGEYKDK